LCRYFIFEHSLMQKIISVVRVLLFALTAALGIHSCANVASPTGGLYDEAPPKMLRAKPDFNALNVTPKKIQIEFDENVKIEKPLEKIIITPPQKNMPTISSVGRKVVVELNDTLQPSTTYTIDFTDAIADNNEGNPLENFSLSFSTGNELDTLAVSGTVLAADNLEPAQGIYVGIHSNLNDTAFTKTIFDRISRTDSRGRFTVKGMKEGKYHIFALDDKNRDYKYDNPQETIAFLDSIIVPSTAPAFRQDTVFNPKDSTKIDTIKDVHYTKFLPDNIILRSFATEFQRKYLQKTERPERHQLNIFFGAPTNMPSFSLLNPDLGDDDSWYKLERSEKNDSLKFWITDSTVYKVDSISMSINYLRTDSLNKDYIATDTLLFIYKAPKEEKKKKSKKEDEKEKEEIRFLSLTCNVQATFDIFNPIHIEFEQPVMDFDSTKIKLTAEKDSLFLPTPYTLVPDTLNPRKFTILKKWDAGQKYKLAVDSADFHGYYGLWNNKLDQPFTIKKLEEYGNLMIYITGLPPGKKAYVELLNKQDKPFRKAEVKNNAAKFQDLLPTEFYARLFIDENEDGKWTPGDYELHRQPETVYYFPRSSEIRAFSDHEEEWDLNQTPAEKQKPLDITKNKPEEKKKRNLNEERNNQRNNNQRNRNNSRGGSGNVPQETASPQQLSTRNL
jgi:hypothetical protein